MAISAALAREAGTTVPSMGRHHRAVDGPARPRLRLPERLGGLAQIRLHVALELRPPCAELLLRRGEVPCRQGAARGAIMALPPRGQAERCAVTARHRSAGGGLEPQAARGIVSTVTGVVEQQMETDRPPAQPQNVLAPVQGAARQCLQGDEGNIVGQLQTRVHRFAQRAIGHGAQDRAVIAQPRRQVARLDLRPRQHRPVIAIVRRVQRRIRLRGGRRGSEGRERRHRACGQPQQHTYRAAHPGLQGSRAAQGNTPNARWQCARGGRRILVSCVPRCFPSPHCCRRS